MTARDLIASSLRLIGVLGAGETATNDDAADALTVLSQMVDAWSAERLTLFQQDRVTKALTGGVQRYTIGSGGDIATTRPLWIDRANFQDASGNEYQGRDPDGLYTRDEWARTFDKDLQTNVPAGIYYNPEYPLGKIDVYPVPSDGTYTLVLYLPASALTSVASLNTAISMPPGWAKALRYNLAVDLAPEYGKAADPAIVAQAIESKAIIQRTNIPTDTLRLDPMFRPRAGGWSYHTGDFRNA